MMRNTRISSFSILARSWVWFPTGAISRLSGRWTQAHGSLWARLCEFPNSSTHPRPARMLQSGRGVDNNSRRTDWLYRRCVKEDIEGERCIPARISYDDTSVNWSKYSRPWDVIFDYPAQGVARWIVSDLPTDLPENPPPK